MLTTAAAFGGLAAAQPLQSIALEQDFSNGPLQITPHALVAGCGEDKVPSGVVYATRNGQSVVVLRATIQNAVGEDIPFGSEDSTRVFKLASMEPEAEYMGVFPEGIGDSISDIAARMKMDAFVIWKVPTRMLDRATGITLVVYDLGKTQSVMLPTEDWMTTRRMTGGQLTVPLTRC
ncbi:hypothetical protein [Mycobacterium sp. NPDC050853]|uniref:hypothetical protein n=1 Tax=Mycobacterium sp. NPDC050853 TaxID=3155160 RepID=UPI003410A2D2